MSLAEAYAHKRKWQMRNHSVTHNFCLNWNRHKTFHHFRLIYDAFDCVKIKLKRQVHSARVKKVRLNVECWKSILIFNELFFIATKANEDEWMANDALENFAEKIEINDRTALRGDNEMQNEKKNWKRLHKELERIQFA